MLSFQSFEKNQNILSLVNRLIIYIKLTSQGIDPKISYEEFQMAKKNLVSFLRKLNDSLVENKSNASTILGMDERSRTLVKNFLEAKSKSQKFKSVLFKKSPLEVVQLLENTGTSERQTLLDSLAELRTLIEEHVSIDIKELIGNI